MIEARMIETGIIEATMIWIFDQMRGSVIVQSTLDGGFDEVMRTGKTVLDISDSMFRRQPIWTHGCE